MRGLKAIAEELLALNTSSNIQNSIILFDKRVKATQNVDMLCILHDGTFIYECKTIADLFSGFLANNNEFLNDTVSKSCM